MGNIPDNFEPLFRDSPYLNLLGPAYSKKTDSGITIGLYVESKHCNNRDLLHGGVISGLADIALGYNLAFAGEDVIPVVTTSLSVDFVSFAKAGDWIEIETDVQKVGKSMAFANCYVLVESKRIARASGVFKVVSSHTPLPE